ncbi:hypothetical protein AB0K89_26395 [Streptomyces cinnamoneus]|uniref:hypothetical protein n=1 Tax=Streptomyces cinnamoneus TaxID=53446 RepID=UPI003443F214
MADQLAEISAALHQGTWVPTEEECLLASSYFTGLRKIPELHLLAVPEGAGLEPSWSQRACHLAAQADLADRLLAGNEPDGPMMVLLRKVSEICSPLRELAEQVRQAWQAEPPGRPSDEDLHLWADRSVQAALAEWDLAHVSEADHERVSAAEGDVMFRVQSTMMAALGGEVDW